MKGQAKNLDLETTFRILRHDLINPVSAIRMTADALLLDEKNPKKKSNLESIKNMVDEEISLIRDVSAYTQLLLEKNIKKNRFNIKKIFEDNISLLKRELDSSGIVLVFDSEMDREITADKNLQLALKQLLSNSIKYSPKNGVVNIGFNIKSNKIIFYFKDKGLGVENKYKKSIFTRFRQEDKGGIAGFGVGLAIVKKIADLNKGKAFVRDNPYGGSIFCFEIPLY
jgi:signal transduction histidine kinase